MRKKVRENVANVAAVSAAQAAAAAVASAQAAANQREGDMKAAITKWVIACFNVDDMEFQARDIERTARIREAAERKATRQAESRAQAARKRPRRKR